MHKYHTALSLNHTDNSQLLKSPLLQSLAIFFLSSLSSLEYPLSLRNIATVRRLPSSLNSTMETHPGSQASWGGRSLHFSNYAWHFGLTLISVGYVPRFFSLRAFFCVNICSYFLHTFSDSKLCSLFSSSNILK